MDPVQVVQVDAPPVKVGAPLVWVDAPPVQVLVYSGNFSSIFVTVCLLVLQTFSALAKLLLCFGRLFHHFVNFFYSCFIHFETFRYSPLFLSNTVNRRSPSEVLFSQVLIAV